MSSITVGLIGLAILFLLLTFGLPIGAGMGLVGFFGLLYLLTGKASLTKMALVPFETVHSYTLATLPLFLLMAQVASVSGITEKLYDLASKWLGHRRGGIGMATIMACGVFAAISASSIATAVTMGLVALPEMRKHKYDPALATGCIAAGGTIGSLIPPSGILIIYAIMTEQSIGTLFISGIIPGILEAIGYMALIYILCWWNPNLGPRAPSSTFREKAASLTGCGEIIGLIILVIGGLMIGWFTPTEAGAVGSFGVTILSLVRGRLTWRNFVKAVVETIRTSGMIFSILIGALILNYFLAVSNIPFALSEYVGGLPLSPLAIMLLVALTYFVLGCFIDAAAMVMLTIPIFTPLVESLGYDLIWFGIFVVKVQEIAMITPPVGMNVYVISGVAEDVPMQTIFRGVIPFVIVDLLLLASILLFPGYVLYLPNLLG
jgi:C4-dicarboxylate transporter DctM subunit